MRFFEFGNGSDTTDKLIVILRNYVGRAASKKAAAELNWAGLNGVLKASGSEITADYETFKAIYDSNPIIQKLVSNFNAQGIELNVPGGPKDQQTPQDGETPAEKIDKIASGAVSGQLDQYSKGVQA